MKQLFAYHIALISLLLLFSCNAFYKNTATFQPVSTYTANKPFERILIVFEGAKKYEYFYQGMLADMETAFAGRDIIYEPFFRGMMAYGQKSYKEEQKLLTEKIQDFQPDHMLSIRQADWQSYQVHTVIGSIENGTINPEQIGSRKSLGQFNVEVMDMETEKQVWSGILETKFHNDFGQKANKDFIKTANKEMMKALYDDGYIRQKN